MLMNQRTNTALEHGTTMKKQAPSEKPDDASPPLAQREFFEDEEQSPFQSIGRNTFHDNDEDDRWQKVAKTNDDDSPGSISRAEWLQVAADVGDNLPEIHEATPSSPTTNPQDGLAHAAHIQLPWGMYSQHPACTCAHNHMSSSWQYGYHYVPFQQQAASAMPPSLMAMPPVPQQDVNGASAQLHAASAAAGGGAPLRPPPPYYPPNLPMPQHVVDGAPAQHHVAAAPPPAYYTPKPPAPQQAMNGASAQHHHVAAASPPTYYSAKPPAPQVVNGAPGHPQHAATSTTATAPPPPYYPPMYPVPPHLPHPFYQYYMHTMPPPPPRPLPMLLYTPSDDEILSDYQIFVRQQIEFFEADVKEVKTAMPGRKKPISLHQIGIRCRHCSNVPIAERKAAAAYFPTKVSGLYQAAQNIASTHLGKSCPNLSKEHRETLVSFQQQRNGKRAMAGHGGKQYWADIANAMGIHETSAGLRLVRG